MSATNEHSARIKTALILLGILAVVGLVNAPWLTWLFLGLVYALSLPEAMRLFRTAENALYPAAAAIWLGAWFLPHPTDMIFAAALVMGALLAYRKRIDPRAFGVLLYPTAGLLYLWMLYREYGMSSLLWILVIVALTDIGAYYTGRKLGKTPFSPTSPKKTLEGVFGGVALGTLGGAALMMGQGLGAGALLLALIASVASVFGDLFESWLKREAGVKDSGDILPGHGGILDRIDGYLFAAPALYLLLSWTGV